MVRPSGSVTSVTTCWPCSASTTASTVPSPPSAMGTPTHSASGITSSTPARIAATASVALIDSLNESGARTIFIGSSFAESIRSQRDENALEFLPLLRGQPRQQLPVGGTDSGVGAREQILAFAGETGRKRSSRLHTCRPDDQSAAL